MTPTDLFNAMATTAGQLIQDSFPFWAILVGSFLAIFAISMIVRGFQKGLRHIRK